MSKNTKDDSSGSYEKTAKEIYFEGFCKRMEEYMKEHGIKTEKTIIDDKKVFLFSRD